MDLKKKTIEQLNNLLTAVPYGNLFKEIQKELEIRHEKKKVLSKLKLT
jgi:hypothetical protein